MDAKKIVDRQRALNQNKISRKKPPRQYAAKKSAVRKEKLLIKDAREVCFAPLDINMDNDWLAWYHACPCRIWIGQPKAGEKRNRARTAQVSCKTKPPRLKGRK